MKNSFTLGLRVLKQLIRDKWFLLFSLAAPALIIFVLKIFFDTFPDQFPVQNYILGIAATIVLVITFVLSMISVVEERVNGTLQRIFVSGISKTAMIMGYIYGYLVIATGQSIIVVFMTLLLFDLELKTAEFAGLLLAIWLLAIASVALGILISSFVRRQVQIIPFIPLVMIPSVFLSGIIVNIEDLPMPAQIVGKATPLHYANNIITNVMASGWSFEIVFVQILPLLLIISAIIFLASLTIKPVE